MREKYMKNILNIILSISDRGDAAVLAAARLAVDVARWASTLRALPSLLVYGAHIKDVNSRNKTARAIGSQHGHQSETDSTQ